MPTIIFKTNAGTFDNWDDALEAEKSIDREILKDHMFSVMKIDAGAAEAMIEKLISEYALVPRQTRQPETCHVIRNHQVWLGT